MKLSHIIKIRKVLAAASLAGFLILFAWGNSFIPCLEKLAEVQIGPALLAGSLVILFIQACAAILFGRIYCSLLCPLGLTQDFLSIFRKKRSYKYHKSKSWLRLAILGLFLLSLASGYLFMYNALDPYSVFGRIAAAIFSPLLTGLNNFLAWCAEHFDFYIPARQENAFGGWPVLLLAILSFGLLGSLVIKHGRLWCNYCPAGTMLGLLAHKSFFRIRLDANKCISCGLCQKSCKTGCININERQIDAGRCVGCLDCADACPKKALAYAGPESGKAPGESALADSRRAFLNGLLPTGLLLYGIFPAKSAGAEEKKDAQALPQKLPPARKSPLVPPGSKSLEHFSCHCIGCQLCASVCPNKVLLSPAYASGLLQPRMSFEHGYCRPNCVKCGELCPAGAIEKLSTAGKRQIRIGLAAVDRERCIINRDKVPCTACQRICPQGAISLRSLSGRAEDPQEPFVDKTKCTGCGACEYICPSRPAAAIAVNGYAVHAHADDMPV